MTDSQKTIETRVDRRFGVPGPGQFRTTVEIECARSERYQTPVSLVCLHVGEMTDRTAGRMTALLSRRMRCSDYIGWWDEDSLCVLLTDTDLKGGWVYALRSVGLLEQNGLRARFSVYTFPRRWFDNDDTIPLSARATAGDQAGGEAVVAEMVRNLATPGAHCAQPRAEAAGSGG